MAIAQVRHADLLIRNWGLAQTLPYGRAVSMLFSGPSGVGKTACAETVAHELGRPILVADYSRIQDCWVGETEKNIVNTFRNARRNRAVLFWDEADAMFYDRNQTRSSWEVRDVNVLLQELERFDGVCVLATNRKASLDPALERRLTLKVEFERPGRDLRRRIWQKLLPAKMPLGPDVDLDRLAAWDLSGGEIKNVILNAARLALARDPKGLVRMQEFEQAASMSDGSGWSKAKRVGFTKER
jgi:SpoVK/Ycf46/Vps4 family AAA+-type ATPase